MAMTTTTTNYTGTMSVTVTFEPPSRSLRRRYAQSTPEQIEGVEVTTVQPVSRERVQEAKYAIAAGRTKVYEDPEGFFGELQRIIDAD